MKHPGRRVDWIGLPVKLHRSGIWTAADNADAVVDLYLDRLEVLAAGGDRRRAAFCADCDDGSDRLGELVSTRVGAIFAADVRWSELRQRALSEAKALGGRPPRVPSVVGKACYALTPPHAPSGWLAEHLARRNQWPASAECPRHGVRGLTSDAVQEYRAGANRLQL